MHTVEEWESIYSTWLVNAALPLWSERGVDRQLGGFQELLDDNGAPLAAPRRARVQGRQSFVFSSAAKLGRSGDWAGIAGHGIAYLERYYRRPDGLFRTLVAPDGRCLDDAAKTYDQAFVLLATASMYSLDPSRDDLNLLARNLVSHISALRRHPQGGFREDGEQGFLSNPHMHLLESALAWIESEGHAMWHALAGEIVTLCLTRFIDPDRNVLREYFDADWNPAAGHLGRIVEPGHQFEWAWLLERWARLSGNQDAHAAALVLFAAGKAGIDEARNVAIDEMDDSLTPRRSSARLWPQTERLKAALLLRQGATGAARQSFERDACSAAAGLWQYLQVPKPGLWHDKMTADGGFVAEPSPASTLYHIVAAIMALAPPEP